MNETQFLHKNIKKWEEFENLLEKVHSVNPDKLSDMFINLTDDLSYARSFYPNSKSTQYLNNLTQKAHQVIYRNQPTEKSRIGAFWGKEFPLLIYSARKEILVAFIITFVSALIGILSNKYDTGFSRIIMGDSYINMTLSNIEKGDPLAVYKQGNQIDMFLGITVNNIRVSFIAFVFGLLTPIGTGFILMKNGVMLGTFQSFIGQQGFLLDSIATIWVHGTLEMFSIIVAGGAGIVIGNSILFPGTYSRLQSFQKGVAKGAKMALGLVPLFIVAGFLEGFVTRYTHAPYVIRFSIIGASLIFIIIYFYIYPRNISLKKIN